MIQISFYLGVAAILFSIGLYCLVTKRNIIRILIGLEIMSAAPNLLFIAFSANQASGLIDPLAHGFVITAIIIDGAILGVGIALALIAYRRYKTLDVRELRRLRW